MDRRVRGTAHGALLVGVWVAATVLAAAVAWGAVTRLNHVGVDAAAPLSQSDVERALTEQSATGGLPSHDTSPTTPPGNGATSSPPASSHQRFGRWVITGGMVGATCRGDHVSVSYATPRDGWSVLPPSQHADRITVRFTRGNLVSTLEARCRLGVPVASIDGHTLGSGGGYEDQVNEHDGG